LQFGVDVELEGAGAGPVDRAFDAVARLEVSDPLGPD
jgi:hypothetical protein